MEKEIEIFSKDWCRGVKNMHLTSLRCVFNDRYADQCTNQTQATAMQASAEKLVDGYVLYFKEQLEDFIKLNCTEEEIDNEKRPPF